MTPLYGQINSDSLLEVAKTLPDASERAEFLEKQRAGLFYADFKDPVAFITEQLALAKQLGDAEDEARRALDLVKAANYVGKFSLADSLIFHYVLQAKDLENKKVSFDLYHEAAKASFLTSVTIKVFITTHSPWNSFRG